MKELDQISYRDYYQKYKKRLESMVTPNPIENVSEEKKKDLAQIMQAQGILSNEQREQQQLERRHQIQKNAVAANIYNKEIALKKKRELGHISPLGQVHSTRLS